MRAVARPMPLVAPVMTMTCLLSGFLSNLHLGLQTFFPHKRRRGAKGARNIVAALTTKQQRLGTIKLCFRGLMIMRFRTDVEPPPAFCKSHVPEPKTTSSHFSAIPTGGICGDQPNVSIFDKKLQYPVKVETPDPLFARMLQQAIGGIEGEIRVCMQYFFQAWGARSPTTKYRDMLLNTATEEMGHIEMLATAVAMNLETAPTSLQEEGAKDKVVGAVMGSENPRHVIEGDAAIAMCYRPAWRLIPPTPTACPSTCRTSMPAETSPPTCTATSPRNRPVASWPFASLMRRHDPGMKDMLHFMIARDTDAPAAVARGHRGRWAATPARFRSPTASRRARSTRSTNYNFYATAHVGEKPESGRWTHGPSLDGKGKFTVFQNKPMGEEPVLGPARPDSGAQADQIA